jgi:ABC-2 type transport system ATP-binding protein
MPTDIGDGGLLYVRAADPVPVLHQLTGWALDRGTTLLRLTVDRPTLEDVYLELTTEVER